MNKQTIGFNEQHNHEIDLRSVEDHSVEVAEVIASYGHTILDVTHVGQTDEHLAYTIGEGHEVSFPVSGATLPDAAGFTLVTRTEAGFILRFTADMNGSVRVGDHVLGLAELIATQRARPTGEGSYAYLLPSGARAKVAHGEVHFHVNLVKRGALIAKRGKVDRPFWGVFAGTATVAMAFYMLMRSTPDNAMAMQLDDEDAAARFAAYFHQADQNEEAEPEELEPDQPSEPSNEPSSKPGGAAKGPSGKMGDKASNNPSGKYKLKGPANTVPQYARNYDPVAAASQAGILGILAAQDQSFIAAVDGGAFNVGNDDATLWGNITGIDYAAANGVMGMGHFDVGPGGGGATNVIGLDETGLIGDGPGTSAYPGPGDSGVTGFGKHRRKVPTPRVGKGKVTGQVDKDMIRRVVRAHINEVRSCYNKGLSSNPNLQGRVAVQFTIVGNGKVTTAVAVENTTKSSKVADCIAKAVKRWKFPPVRGGGTALVTYPFLLNAR